MSCTIQIPTRVQNESHHTWVRMVVAESPSWGGGLISLVKKWVPSTTKKWVPSQKKKTWVPSQKKMSPLTQKKKLKKKMSPVTPSSHHTWVRMAVAEGPSWGGGLISLVSAPLLRKEFRRWPWRFGKSCFEEYFEGSLPLESVVCEREVLRNS